MIITECTVVNEYPKRTSGVIGYTLRVVAQFEDGSVETYPIISVITDKPADIVKIAYGVIARLRRGLRKEPTTQEIINSQLPYPR